MTRLELVKLLEENYREDDEVYVMYRDDQGQCIDMVCGVEDVMEEHCYGHHELRDENGEWIPLADGEVWNYSRNDTRYVVDGIRKSTRKCIVV